MREQTEPCREIPYMVLVNDDARNIQCVKKSANFINKEPFVVSNSDKLTLKLLQKSRREKSSY